MFRSPQGQTEFNPRGIIDDLLRDLWTYITLSFATLLLAFIFYLGGWSGIYELLKWAEDSDDWLGWLGFPTLFYYIGFVLLLAAFREWTLYTLIRNTPTSHARSAAAGRVEVKGKARPLGRDALLESPFQGTGCVMYECKIEELRSDGDDEHWVTIYKDRRSPGFYLEDDTGRVAVDPSDAEWGFEADYREKFQENDVPERIARFSQQHITESSLLDVDWMGGEWRRFTEWFLEPGESLYLLGRANPVSGSNRDRFPDADLLIQRDPATDSFYLSDSSEKTILSRKRLRIWICTTLGILLVPSMIWMLCEVLAIV